jgi:predicted regulator of Ras-like GTPase activity (Roadblock/LC7/MglB family)
MSIRGHLKDMAVADLIQHNCQDRKTASVSIQNEGQEAFLFFKDGAVIHAALNDCVGEDAIFQLLAWSKGTFILETGVEPPAQTVQRSWSSLLLEGARRLDEGQLEEINPLEPFDRQETPEVNQMPNKMNDVLKELSAEVSGYLASAVVGMDGLSVADHTKTAKTNVETVSAQMALLLKLVDTSTSKMKAGVVEDNLLATDSAYVLMRFLPRKGFFLGIAVDRKTGNLGNLRLMSKLYAERIAKAMPN